MLQEETLDELELVAANPPPPNRRLAGAAIHDFVRWRDGQKYYVFITVFPLPAQGLVRVSEIAVHFRTPEA
jgi:hypothetical protein